MNSGHSNPSSNESTVPDTAPTANRIAVHLAHRLARTRYAGLPVFCHRYSEIVIINAKAPPTAAKIIWKANVIPIYERAARRSLCLLSLGFRGFLEAEFKLFNGAVSQAASGALLLMQGCPEYAE